jgi:site-specific DNA recombinase
MSLTIAYCRVSTVEQAAEGFSIDGQTDKLRAYAELHDLGPVHVVTDPGLSGKNLDRPGLQQVLAMVEAGHVAHVLIWRLDRLSRDVGDLAYLAKTFQAADVALHSFTEKLDMTSATGRMFFNILASFAQFYREQLAENVRMGQHQAVRQGKWINRPKTGYDLIDGNLIANDDADTVREIFAMRTNRLSYRQIEDQTGLNYSTVRSILDSRIYLGEVLLNGEWFPGVHDPILTRAAWDAAHKGEVRGRRLSRHILAGRVRCGLCHRVMSVETNGEGRAMYRCRHRGQGCAMPRRTATGLVDAALLGLRLIASDEALQEAIRRELAAGERPEAERPGAPQPPDPAKAIDRLAERRRKLLSLHYDDKISADLFAEQEADLTNQINALRDRAPTEQPPGPVDDLATRFEEVVESLIDLDLNRLWQAATDQERRILIEELLDSLEVLPDRLVVGVHGAPKLNVALAEVGLGNGHSVNVGVEGGT